MKASGEAAGVGHAVDGVVQARMQSPAVSTTTVFRGGGWGEMEAGRQRG